MIRDGKRAIVIIACLVLLVVASGLWLAIAKDIPVFFVWAAASIGAITFFGFIFVGYDLEGKPAIHPSTIRTAITVSVIMVYLFVVSLTIFLREWSDNLDPLPQLMVSNFTTMVGVIIAFYFTSSAYIEAQKKNTRQAPEIEKSASGATGQ